MALHIESGYEFMQTRQVVDGSFVKFVNERGATIFEVRCCDDKSIEIFGVESSKVNGVIYDNTLSVAPKASNCVRVSVNRYES